MEHTKDLELFNLVRKGDKEALSLLYNNYYAPLMHYGLRIHYDKIHIEECIHEMFLYIFEAGERLGVVNNIRAYLFSSLRRRILKTLKAQRKLTDEISDYIDTNTLFSLNDLLVTKDVDSLKHKVILEALNNLSWRKREAIYLRYYNGLSTKEIAAIMAISNQTVLNTIYQGLNKMRELLTTNNFQSFILAFACFVDL